MIPKIQFPHFGTSSRPNVNKIPRETIVIRSENGKNYIHSRTIGDIPRVSAWEVLSEFLQWLIKK
jgi:hypothetical protein